MTKRMIICFCMALVLASQANAQAPDEEQGTPVQIWVDQPSTSPMVASTDMGCSACSCSQGGQYWITADGMVGWVQRSQLPPLVTTSPTGTAQSAAGILGNSTTSIIFGNTEANGEPRSGFHLGAGWWFDRDHTFGVEAGFRMLESQASLFSATSSTFPILARPYVDATTNNPQAVLVAFPGSSTGSIDARASSGNFYEWHLDFMGNIASGSWWRLDGLLGYCGYHLDDGLRIRQTVNPTGGTFVPGTQISSVDDFSAQNQFNGGDIGLKAQVNSGKFTLDLMAKVAAGVNQHDVDINGVQRTSSPNANPTVTEGGVLALSSNIGNHGTSEWTVMPECGANLSWQATSHIRLQVGYSLLYLIDVARAADQVSLNVNPNLFPPPSSTATPSAPAFNFVRSDIWVQTLNLGVEYSF